jgi:Na+-driven multidrug efflux pump
LWDVLEAFTEGIGEASAIQVAFLLAAAQPERAKKLSYSILYVGFIQSLLVTSCLYMGGRYLAILVTNDQVLQYMTNESLALLGLANITMSFSQVAWSLIGAQGRFRLGTKVMFFSRWLVTIPLACVTIFFLYLDLSCIGGCLVVGYSTASCVLTCIVLKSDWERLMHLMQEVKSTPFPEKQELDFDFDDDFSSSEGFGSDVDREEASDGKRRKSAKRQVLRHRPHENP